MHNSIEQLALTYNISRDALNFLKSPHKMYINGRFTDGLTDETLTILEPCTEHVLATVPKASKNDVDLAVIAARNAFESGPWAKMKPLERERILYRLADLLEADFQTIAEIESLDAGKPITGCKAADVSGSIKLLRYMSGWASKIEGATRTTNVSDPSFAFTIREPIGVVAAIVPWNWPLSMAIWKLAAPLAVGCTIVLKPSEITPMSMLYFAELCESAGVPPGVINIINGEGADIGSYLVSHQGVDKVSFTGSTETGCFVGQSAMTNITPVTLELGGKSPMIVFKDANINQVVSSTQRSIFFNAGQVCSAGSRMYVHKDIYRAVIQAVVDEASKMKRGFTLDSTTEVGPVISRQQFDKVHRYINLGMDEGACLECGGEVHNGPGYFIEPTIFSDCRNDMTIVQEEIFGPVLSILPFDSDEQAISLANNNIYGLAASIFTQNMPKALTLISKIKAGTVWVNTHDVVDVCIPFGGFKFSGLGKDMGPEQLDHFLQTKSVWVDLSSDAS